MQGYYAAKKKGTCACGNKPIFRSTGRVLSSSCPCGEEVKLDIPLVRRYDVELEKAKVELNNAAEEVLTVKFDFLFGYSPQQDALGDKKDAYLKAKRRFQDLSAKVDQLTMPEDQSKTLRLMKDSTKDKLTCERFRILQSLECRSRIPFEDMEMIEKETKEGSEKKMVLLQK
jgi:hypothetical protein